MNFIQSYILRKAEKIKDAESTKKRAEMLRKLEEDEQNRSFERQCRNEIMTQLQAYADAKKAEDIHIKAGDEAVLNIYELVRESANGWDLGSSSMTDHIKKSEYPDALKVKIADVYVDMSLAEERVDKFFDQHSIPYLRKSKNSGTSIWQQYVKWLTAYYNTSSYKGTVFDQFGIYRAAHFTTQHAFWPKWGLNINSFLAKGSIGYDETLEIAQCEKMIEESTKKHDEFISSINATIDSLKQSVEAIANNCIKTKS